MKINFDAWLANNTNQIESGLLKHAEDLPVYRTGNRKLPLSDLELCAVIDKRMVPLPPNFVPKQVEVKVGKRRWYTSHFIGTNGSEVIDYVPGIFFAEEVRRISGISYMLEQAPQLIHVLSDEVSVLYASLEEAKELLQLEYILK